MRSASRLSPLHEKPKNFIDEVLDGLDTMMGVSPLSEEDLKSPEGATQANLVQRMEERDKAAPPSDALSKPSVAIFFFVLALVPTLISIAALKSGVRPLGL